MNRYTLHHGDALDVLRTLPDASVDAVVTDPPYAEIDRPYGRLTEPEWHALMDGAVAEIRRVLRPTGSAVFILQPNSERVGRMRPWLWEFMARWSREWNMPQDCWWWNSSALPTVHCRRENGLMRPSVKACVWLGPSDCYRAQDRVLVEVSKRAHEDRNDFTAHKRPSGAHVVQARACRTAIERGGATPFNLLKVPNSNSTSSGGFHGHGAATPYELCSWWVRYLCPADGLVLDPFAGSGTTGVAALAEGMRFIGVEREAAYVEIAQRRLAEADQPSLFGGAA